MSVLVGTGNILWSGIYVIASTIGLAVTVALGNILYVNPYNVQYSWYKGLLLVVGMIVSVVVFGGFVIVLWHSWERKTWAHHVNNQTRKRENASEVVHSYRSSGKDQYVNTIRYGQRPNFGGMLSLIRNTKLISYCSINTCACLCRDIWSNGR